MANLTTRIGGQHYYDAATTNSEKLLNFWKGTGAQYTNEKETRSTTRAAISGTSATITVY